MKVQLVFAKQSLGHSVQDRYLPPLGLLTLAAYAKSKISELDIEILDENADVTEDITKRLTGDVIGFSCWFSNYSRSLALARQLGQRKQKPKIIFGGPSQTHCR